MDGPDDLQDFRRRSGQTKRERSRQALIEAAEQVFSERGWQDSHIEDIAQAAGLSSATTYNHFPGSKQQLMGLVYAPLVMPLIDAARADIEQRVDPIEAVKKHVRALIGLTVQRRGLTLALLTAAFEQLLKVGRPSGPHDVRVLVPIVQPLMELIEYGRNAGVFEREQPAEEVAAYQGNALLLCLLAQPQGSMEGTIKLVLSQLLPPLVANPDSDHRAAA